MEKPDKPRARKLKDYGSWNKILPDRSGEIPTEKQVQARERNWNIRKLRAFYHLIPQHLIGQQDAEKIEKIIDKHLKKMKAEPESVRVKRRYEEMMDEAGS